MPGAHSSLPARFFACAGVAVLVGLSMWVGFEYWQSRHEEQLAWITVGVELIAFAGLACARASWGHAPGWAVLAVILTILAASWCGFTMFQKISDDGRARAIAQAEQSLAYVTAKTDLQDASASLRLALAAPRPELQGPLTITAWDAAQAATVARLTHARDDAIVRVNASLPAIQFDWIAVVRGVGVELIKLLGFAAFGGLSLSPSQNSHWLRNMRLGGAVGASALMMATPVNAQAPENSSLSQVFQPDPIVRFPETSKKAQAFAMRGRLKACEIAEKIDVHQSTVYRWFADRDKRVLQSAA